MKLMNASNPSFPLRPSEAHGYRSLDLNEELPKIRRSRWYARFALLLAPTLAAGLVALDIRNEWSEDLNQGLPLGIGLYLLGAILLFGVAAASFQHAFGGWRTEFEQCRRNHLNENINLVAKRIAEAIGTDQGWNWFRPANWGDCYFVTVGGCLVLINLTDDWIRYIVAESVRDVRYDCRRVGSTSQSESRAHTIGAGGYLFTASTTVESTGQTVDSYRHVVDIYTTEQGNEHLCADFASDENLAKRAYACLLPLSERAHASAQSV